jgi:hypothetical protein
MLDENLIATLEQSLRQTRNAQQRLITRLNEVETEGNRLRSEIEALENSAAQTEQAIYSLLATMRSGNQSWNLPKNFLVDDDYDIPQDIKRSSRMNQNNQNNQINYNNQNNQNNQNNPPNNYRNNNQISYINNSRNIPSIAPHIEPVSHRFTDRTITQACTLLLREYQRPLHVNEIYNLLVSGGMEFTGNNPTISIAVSLNRNIKFRKVAPGTFDLILRDASQTGS